MAIDKKVTNIVPATDISAKSQVNNSSESIVEKTAGSGSIFKTMNQSQVASSAGKANADSQKSFDDPYNTFDILKNYYNSGHSADETYNYLKKIINDSKNNPDKLSAVVSNMLCLGYIDYDTTQKREKIADSNPEILKKFLTQDKVDGAICTTIHGFMMDTLNSCGIPAALVTGNSDSSPLKPHTTLLYQTKKGEYVWNNYGSSTKIKSDNIISAVKSIEKNSPVFSSSGALVLQGDGKNYYSEYAYKDEAAFGKEIDKADILDSKSAFDVTPIQDKNSITPSETISENSTQTRVKLNRQKIISSSEIAQNSLEVEYKDSSDTELFNSSKSYGIKDMVADKVSPNSKTQINVEFGGIVSHVDGKSLTSNGTTKEVPSTTIQSSGLIAYKSTILKSPSTDVSVGAELAGTGYCVVDGLNIQATDVRTSLEGGVDVKHSGDKFSLENSVSVGKTADVVTTDFATQRFGESLGYKVNSNNSVNYKPSKDLSLSASADAYLVKTNNSEHKGVSGSVGVQYESSKHDNLYGGVASQFESKNLTIGQFDENIDSKSIVTLYGGVKLAKSFDIGVNISEDFNKKNKEGASAGVGVKYDY